MEVIAGGRAGTGASYLFIAMDVKSFRAFRPLAGFQFLQEQLSSSYGLRLPGLLVPEHGVDLCQEGAHAGDQGHLGAFAPASECLIALLQGRLGADRAPSGHVQHAPDASAPTPDAAQSALAAAVGVVGGDA